MKTDFKHLGLPAKCIWFISEIIQKTCSTVKLHEVQRKDLWVRVKDAISYWILGQIILFREKKKKGGGLEFIPTIQGIFEAYSYTVFYVSDGLALFLYILDVFYTCVQILYQV